MQWRSLALVGLLACQSGCHHWVSSTPADLARATQPQTVRLSLVDGESFVVQRASVRAAAVEVSGGLAVLSADADAAWPLARAVYANATLRPPALDEAHARVLAGEPPPQNSSPELRELAELRIAVRDEDGASRQFLGAIAKRFGLAAILVVTLDEERRPIARMFEADAARFDATTYAPDFGGSRWVGAIGQLANRFALSNSATSLHGFGGTLVGENGVALDVRKIAGLEVSEVDNGATAALVVVTFFGALALPIVVATLVWTTSPNFR